MKCITLIGDFILIQLAADQITQNEVGPSLLLKGPFLLLVNKEYYQRRMPVRCVWNQRQRRGQNLGL